MFLRVKSLGRRATFANVYPEQFFEFAKRKDRWSVTTRACLDAQIRIRTIADLNDGLGLAADITGLGLRNKLNLPVITLSEHEAANNLVNLLQTNELVVFEYYLTDKAGHAQDLELAKKYLLSLDRFIGSIVETIHSEPITLVISSDHGNIEDLSIKTHTRNPVPLVAFGPAAPALAKASSLVDVTPAIVRGFEDSR